MKQRKSQNSKCMVIFQVKNESMFPAMCYSVMCALLSIINNNKQYTSNITGNSTKIWLEDITVNITI